MDQACGGLQNFVPGSGCGVLKPNWTKIYRKSWSSVIRELVQWVGVQHPQRRLATSTDANGSDVLFATGFVSTRLSVLKISEFGSS